MTNNTAEKIAARSVDDIPQEGYAFSMRTSFEAIEKIADLSIPLRRPKRTTPTTESSLEEELAAWGAASDEALLICEGWE